MDDIKYKVHVHFGMSESQMRHVPAADGWIICESRRVDRDEKGRITFIGDWSPLSRIKFA